MTIRAGQMNTLEVTRRLSNAWVLVSGEDHVHLPFKEVDRPINVGDEVEVFVYTSRGQRTATTWRPHGTVGQLVALEVVDIAEPGVFVDWGLTKDLLIPRSELRSPLHIGDKAVVAIVLDRSERVMGTTWLQKHFSTDTFRLRPGQRAEMLVYGETDRGFQVVVEGRFSGMLFLEQTHRNLEIGQELQGFIQFIRRDGRLDMSLTLPKPKLESLRDEEAAVIDALTQRDGFLPLTDRSAPADIRHELHMSKKAFKRAVGALYKARKITIEAGGIRWKG